MPGQGEWSVLEDSQGCLDGIAEVLAGGGVDQGGHPVDDVQH